MKAPRVWLIRHGETEWSAAGRHTGRTDVPLTEAGRISAKRIGPELASTAFTAVFTSPLRRAKDTCRLAGFRTAAVVVDELVEWDYGQYEGRTTAEIRAGRPDWNLWRDGCPGGESARDVGSRVDLVIRRLRQFDAPIAVFGHGHCLRVLTARWLGLPPSEGALFALDTAAVSVLGWEREQPVVSQWNV